MKIERETLKKVLTDTNKRDVESAVDRTKVTCDRELRILQKSWEDEQVRLNRDINILQKKCDCLPEEIVKATRTFKLDHERLLQQEKTASKRAQAEVKKKCQDEFDRMKDELNGQMVKLREEYANRVTELEKQLDSAHGNRMSSMFQMKEEVETELSERMETLRTMYKKEIEGLQQNLEEQKMSSDEITSNLKRSNSTQKKEIDELNIYCAQQEEEFEAKTNELLTRLQEQITSCKQLQDELDGYEWWEEDDEEAAGKANESGQSGAVPKINHPSRPPSSRSHHGPHSRPSSTRPTDPQNVNHQQKLNSSSQYNIKPPASNSLEPCIEPVNDNTTGVPSHLSPSLSTASSAYFPQNSYTSASHSYYSTAEDNQIEEAKTSEGERC